MRSTHTFVRNLLVLFALLLASGALWAYNFSPLTQTFDPTGAGNTKTYTIVNDSDDAIAISMTVQTRDQDENGEEVNKPVSGVFSIRPAKVIVKPRSSQIVRVQYRGPSTVANELSYRIRVQQIPYSKGKAADDTSMFNFLYNYVTSAYVTPSRTIEKVSVAGVKRVVVTETTQNEDGTETTAQVPKLAVTLRNQGTVHQIIRNPEFVVQDGLGGEVTLTTNEELGPLYGFNILAKKTVTLNIPFPAALSSDPSAAYSASLSYTSR